MIFNSPDFFLSSKDQDLSCGNNREFDPIEDFSLAAMTSLKTLKMSGINLNYVAKNSLAGLANLTELYLDQSELRTIEDDAFVSMNKLQVLDFSFNAHLKALNASVFNGLTSLESLNFAYSPTAFNYNSRIEGHFVDLGGGEDILLSLSNLKFVNLSCALAQGCASGLNFTPPLDPGLLSSLAALEVLDLSRNGLSQWTDDIFAWNRNLTELYVSHNNMVTTIFALPCYCYKDLVSSTYLKSSYWLRGFKQLPY